MLAVLTAADCQADGLKPIPHLANAADAVDPRRPTFVKGPHLVYETPQPVLATDRVRHVGEAVAVVIAETLAQAKDAAEAIEVDYEVLPAVATIEAALAERSPLLWPDAPGNVALDASFGDRAATDAAFAAADLVVAHDFANQRIVNCQMEPRAAIGLFDAADGTYTVISGSQGVVRHRAGLSIALGVPPEKIRAISPDVGGGFGPRTALYPESVLVAWAARRIGRPVRWGSDRSEAFLADHQGRDITTRAAAAFTAAGKLLAVKFAIDGNLGAYPASFAPLANCHRLIASVYDAGAGFAQVRGILTNSAPVAPYRGAGRPEAMFAVERLFDMAAERLGVDRIALRRQNIIGKEQLPYRNLMGLTYDSGDFLGNMEQALAAADWKGFPARQASSRKAGRRRGIGVANYIEAPVGAPRERVVLTAGADGVVELVSGTQSTGQGHETVFTQVIADRLGVPMEAIRVRTGDTSLVEAGGGTHSARSMRLVGTLLCEAGDKLIAQARDVAAAELGVAADALRYADGIFTAIGSNRSLSLFQVAERSAERRIQRFGRAVAPHSGASDRLRGVRARSRSRHRRDRDRALHVGRRRRPADQSADRRRPGARRHRSGHRPGAVRRRGHRRIRPGAHRLVHGLRAAARTRRAELQGRARRGSDRRQSAARERRRRRRHHAGAGGGDQCAGACAA